MVPNPSWHSAANLTLGTSSGKDIWGHCDPNKVINTNIVWMSNSKNFKTKSVYTLFVGEKIDASRPQDYITFQGRTYKVKDIVTYFCPSSSWLGYSAWIGFTATGLKSVSTNPNGSLNYTAHYQTSPGVWTYANTTNTGYEFYKFHIRNLYTLSFNTPGGSAIASITGIQYQYPLGGDESLGLAPIVKPADPTREGYRFLGWYTDSNYRNVFNWEKATMPYNNLELFAKWEPTDYTVTFLDRENGAVVAQTGVSKGGRVADPAIYSEGRGYEGHGVFQGWYLRANANAEVRYPFEMEIYNNLTIYAKWQTGGFTVRYDANGGTGTVPTDAQSYD
jgi:uncharacterized repeat protein (TIGR02543 family)